MTHHYTARLASIRCDGATVSLTSASLRTFLTSGGLGRWLFGLPPPPGKPAGSLAAAARSSMSPGMALSRWNSQELGGDAGAVSATGQDCHILNNNFLAWCGNGSNSSLINATSQTAWSCDQFCQAPPKPTVPPGFSTADPARSRRGCERDWRPPPGDHGIQVSREENGYADGSRRQRASMKWSWPAESARCRFRFRRKSS